MNLPPIPTIVLSEATAAPSSSQDSAIQEDTHNDTNQLQDQQQQRRQQQLLLPLLQSHFHFHSKQKRRTFEQKLMDKIMTMFGPHPVEIAMKQDTIHTSESPHVQQRAQAQPTSSCSSLLSSSYFSSADVGTACVATMLVPGLEPRAVNLSHANGVFSVVRFAWLQDLKIVYRCCGFLLGGLGVGGGMRKACFLDAATFYPLVRRWSWTSEDQEEGGREEDEKEDEENVAVVDLSHCVTLEVLWIEDLDRNGQPHRLRSWKNSVKDLFALAETGGDNSREDDETKDMVPFLRDQGLILPGRLKSLTMVGLSANKFNFGWLRATPKLETLSIHGMRFRGFGDARLPSVPTTTLWDLDRVFLPRLKFFSIHHAPVQQF